MQHSRVLPAVDLFCAWTGRRLNRVALARGTPYPLTSPSAAAMHDKILILDFGSQVTQLIASTRSRSATMYSEIHPCDVDAAFIRDFAPKGVILSGGPNSVTRPTRRASRRSVFDLGVPVLGICYGMQTMADQLGGKVDIGQLREFGYARSARAQPYESARRHHATSRRPKATACWKVWMSHGDKVVDLPPGFTLMASTPSRARSPGMADDDLRFYGLQWHPEVTPTVKAARCPTASCSATVGAKADWEMGVPYRRSQCEKIRAQVGDEHVILGLSGGVDSSVAAALVHRAIGDQLTCVFVDHGLLRLNEAKQVMATFADHLRRKGDSCRRERRCSWRKLEGVTDPEAKRKIIGAEFVEVFQTPKPASSARREVVSRRARSIRT